MALSALAYNTFCWWIAISPINLYPWSEILDKRICFSSTVFLSKIGANLLSACSVSWLIFSKDSFSAISMIPSLIAEWVVDLELPFTGIPILGLPVIPIGLFLERLVVDKLYPEVFAE